MGRKATARDAIARTRWKRFLAEHVGAGNPISVESLDRQIQGALSPTDGRYQIYAYLRGTMTVTAPRAIRVGISLRTLGVEWSGPAVALVAATQVGKFIRGVANLAARGPEELQTAIYIAVLAPLAVAGVVPYDPRGFQRAARTLLSPIGADEVIDQAFERETVRGCDPVLLDIAELCRNAAFSPIGERAALVALREWALDHADVDTRSLLVRPVIEMELERLSNIEGEHGRRRSMVSNILRAIQVDGDTT